MPRGVPGKYSIEMRAAKPKHPLRRCGFCLGKGFPRRPDVPCEACNGEGFVRVPLVLVQVFEEGKFGT
jgi:hypothetical protein